MQYSAKQRNNNIKEDKTKPKKTPKTNKHQREALWHRHGCSLVFRYSHVPQNAQTLRSPLSWLQAGQWVQSLRLFQLFLWPSTWKPNELHGSHNWLWGDVMHLWIWWVGKHCHYHIVHFVCDCNMEEPLQGLTKGGHFKTLKLRLKSQTSACVCGELVSETRDYLEGECMHGRSEWACFVITISASDQSSRLCHSAKKSLK